jgi:DNA-binding cell septation regulator SpoVG
MTIKNYRENPNQDSKIKGFFTLVTQEGIEVKNCKLIQGQKGMFAAPPSQKGKEGEIDEKTGKQKFYDLAWIPPEVQQPIIDELSQEVVPF